MKQFVAVSLVALLFSEVDSHALRRKHRHGGLHRRGSPDDMSFDDDIENASDKDVRRSTDDLVHFLELVEDASEDKAAVNTSTVNATIVAVASTQNTTMQALPTFDKFLSVCLAHVRKVISTVDRAYTDVQLRSVLRKECWLEQKFPSVSEDGFENSTACLRFADRLVAAREKELHNGTLVGYEEFCEEYYVHKGGALKAVDPHPLPQVPSSDVPGGLVWKLLFIFVAVGLLFGVGLMAAYSSRKQADSGSTA